MITSLFVAVLVSGSAFTDQNPPVAVIGTAPPPARSTARTEPVEAGGETVHVCRYEAATGSNRRVRVCRDVPRQGVQDQATREFMRDRQRWTPPPSG